MAKDKDIVPGHAKLIDAWCPPSGAGAPLGVVTTSFTFEPAFFEEDCLGEFLGIRSPRGEDSNTPFYLLEREEKLHNLICAMALVDHTNAKGKRSLRWDFLPVRVPKGIQHAKVTLLAWTQWVRVIVASANMTSQGYRRNQEVFAVFDFFPGTDTPVSVLHETIEFLQDTLRFSPASTGGPDARFKNLKARIESNIKNWPVDPSPRGLVIRPVFSGPGRKDVFSAMKEVLPSGVVLDTAYVTSPFFDMSQDNRPAQEIWECLRSRGEATVFYDLPQEQSPDDSTVFIRAPETLISKKPKRDSTYVICRLLSERDQPSGEIRPIHRKTVWLASDDWNAFLMGSSNFSSAGMGLGPHKNIEANVLYLFRKQAALNVNDEFIYAYIDGEEIEEGKAIQWRPIEDTDQQGAGNLVPSGFLSAVFLADSAGAGVITIQLGAKLPPKWQLVLDDKKTVLFSEAEWKAQGYPNSIEIAWHKPNVPSGLLITWEGAVEFAWLPINVRQTSDLPAPVDLQALSLEVLLSVLTSSKPLHVAMRDLKMRASPRQDGESVDNDPHRKVDTTNFLIQRTRRVSRALAALIASLERPVSSNEALWWRLRGPIGVKAVADAIQKEAKSDSEAVFLVTELCLELIRVNPSNMEGGLSSDDVKRQIRTLVGELKTLIRPSVLESDSKLREYVEFALKEAA